MRGFHLLFNQTVDSGKILLIDNICFQQIFSVLQNRILFAPCSNFFGRTDIRMIALNIIVRADMPS